MKSHTVPRNLLEHFEYDDALTQSKRLWAYQKGKPPWGQANPASATRWDHHFADAANEAKEEEIELRLKQEFEDPVNQFIDLLQHRTFPFNATDERLLTGYL